MSLQKVRHQEQIQGAEVRLRLHGETLWKTRATGLSSEETIAAFTDFIKSVDFSESDILKIITVWLRSHKQEFMRLRQEKSKQVRDELYRRKREKRSRSCPRLVFC